MASQFVTFARLSDGSWGLRIKNSKNLVRGETLRVSKKSGATTTARFGRVVRTLRDGTVIATIFDENEDIADSAESTDRTEALRLELERAINGRRIAEERAAKLESRLSRAEQLINFFQSQSQNGKTGLPSGLNPKDMIRLVHPDRWANTKYEKIANEASKWLNGLA